MKIFILWLGLAMLLAFPCQSYATQGEKQNILEKCVDVELQGQVAALEVRQCLKCCSFAFGLSRSLAVAYMNLRENIREAVLRRSKFTKSNCRPYDATSFTAKDRISRRLWRIVISRE